MMFYIDLKGENLSNIGKYETYITFIESNDICVQIFEQLTLFQPKGADYAHHNTICPLGFSGLQELTALH